MCTSLSHHQDYEGVGGTWYIGNRGSNRSAYELEEEPGAGSVQHLVQDLRSQLTRCHKVIRGLQLRVRSLSATSDYASSLERTPRKVTITSCSILLIGLLCCWFIILVHKIIYNASPIVSVVVSKVNWAFEASPAPSGAEEDEGWMSDTLGTRSEPKPSRELQELVSRVASLEAQLKSSRLEGKGLGEEGKCATWPG